MHDAQLDFDALIAAALRNDQRTRHHSTKVIMRWTDASERTVKNWLAGVHGPSGAHLVQLARHSDEIFDLFLLMADRRPVLTTATLIQLRSELVRGVSLIDRQLV